MSTIDIKETMKTPAIKGDSLEGTLSIKGKSLPENARVFYEPLMVWFTEFTHSHPNVIQVDLDIEYYNTSSSSIIFKILDSLKKISTESKMTINWHYEEDDLEMEEIGLDFQKILGPFFVLRSKKN